MNEMELRKFFAKRIRIRLVKLNIDQRELARRSGISEVTISRYIKGKRKPTYDIVIRLAQALDCTPGYLIDISEELE